MDFGRIECFFCVAKHLNFSRAAEELYLSQSNVTMKISTMEQELGFKLFERSRQGVKLTPSGAYLYKTWSGLYSKIHAGLEHARELSKAPGTSLRLGFHGPVEWAGFYRLISKFHQNHSHIDIRLCVEGMGILKNQLLNERLDMAILELSEIETNPLLSRQFMGRGYSAVALPVGHRLSGRAVLNVDDLKGEQVIMADSTYAPRTLSDIPCRMENAGVDMSNAIMVNRFENALAMCAAGLGIVFMPRPFKVPDSTTLTYIDVDSKEMYLDYALAWHKDNSNPLIQKFCRFINEENWVLE